MKKTISFVPGHRGVKGFSIIEFLVASVLSMIVLMAVGSSYFTSRKLNDSASARLSAQQDLRNAASMIVRDAKMAGNFGCFNMATHPAGAAVEDKTANPSGAGTPFTLKRRAPQGIVLDNLIPAFDWVGVSYPGFRPGSRSLIFHYGVDSEDATAQNMVISSCSEIAKPGKKLVLGNQNDLNEAKRILNIHDNQQNGNIAFQKHEVHAYVVGSFSSGEKGLFRFQLNDQGVWGNPQLLVKNVTGMDIRYLYVENCPSKDAGSNAPEETFKYTSNFDWSKSAVVPAGVQVVLNDGNGLEAAKDNNIYVYHINATIRGGNVCANRTL